MPMNEDILKVRLSPASGVFVGTFTEGLPIAEALGSVFAFQVDGKSGGRMRRYGRVVGVQDLLLSIDNTAKSEDQVVETVIFFDRGPELTIVWAENSVAIGEMAMELEEPDGH